MFAIFSKQGLQKLGPGSLLSYAINQDQMRAYTYIEFTNHRNYKDVRECKNNEKFWVRNQVMIVS